MFSKKFSLLLLALLSFSAASGVEWDFTKSGSSWRIINAAKKEFTSDGLVLETQKNCWLFSPQAGFKAAEFPIMEVEIKSAQNTNAYFYFRNPDNKFAADKGLRIKLPASSDFQTLRLDCRMSPNWKGVIEQFRFDPGTAVGNKVIIRAIRFVPAPQKKAPLPPVAATGETVWNFAKGIQNWRVVNARKYEIAGGVLKITTDKASWCFSPALKIDAAKHKELELVIRSAADCKINIYFRNPENHLSEARRLSVPLKKSDVFQVIRIDCRKSANWKGEIAQIRLDPGHISGNVVEIKEIRFCTPTFGVVPNSDFSRRNADGRAQPEKWYGNIISTDNGAMIKAGGKAYSEWVEIIKPDLLDFALKDAGKVKYQVVFRDISGKEIADLPAAGIVDVPLQAAAFRVEIINNSTADAEIRAVPVTWVERPRPRWSSSWVWNKKVGKNVELAAFFLREFEIADLDQVISATLQGTADDMVIFAVNGHLLSGSNSSNWGAPDHFDIKPFLKKGRNEIRCKVINAGGPGGLLMDLQITGKDGKTALYGSDKLCRTWHIKADGDSLAFNWQNVPADELITVAEPGGWSWGNIAYVPVTAIPGKLTISDLPENVSEKSKGRFKMSLQVDGKPEFFRRKHFNFTLKLKSDRYTILLFDKVIDGNTIDKVIDFGAIDYDFSYLPAGSYQLQVEMDCIILEQPAQKLIMTRNAPVKPAEVKIVNRNGIPQLLINGTDLVFPDCHLANLDKSTNNLRQINNAVANGSQCIWLHYASWKYSDGMKGFDFSGLDDMCANVLVRNPGAYILICVYVDCVGVADMRMKWAPQNRSELARLENGSTWIRNYSNTPEESPSMASEKYLSEGARMLTALYNHLAAQPYGAKVIGILPGSGLTWEWMYWGSQKGDYGDYSEPFQKAFRQWALKRYGSLANVNKAWKSSFADENAIVIPSIAARKSVDFGDLRLPSNTQYLIDFQEFFSDVVSNAVLHFTGTVKKVSGGKLISGAYYGYTNFLMNSNLSHNTGHFALRKVLQSPDFDFQTAPSRYSDRGTGGAGGFMTPEASVALHGKLCITENDIRTVHANNPIGKVNTLAASKAVLEREAAMCAVSGGTVRWFDFSLGWINGDIRLAQVGGNIARVRKILAESGIKAIDPENSVAVFSSERATCYTSFDSLLNSQFVSMAYREFFRSGAGFDCFLLEDIEKVPPYRNWIFLNALHLTEGQRQAIAKAKRNGNLLIFHYGVDVIGQERVTPEKMSEILGFPVKMRRDNYPLNASATINGVSSEFRFARRVDPLFVAEESSGVEVLGRFKDGTPALVRKKFADHTVVFSSVPGIPAEILRELLKDNGARIYNPYPGDVTWAADRVFSVHTADGGKRRFPAPGSARAVELFSGKVYKVTDGYFECTLDKESTVMFMLEK